MYNKRLLNISGHLFNRRVFAYSIRDKRHQAHAHEQSPDVGGDRGPDGGGRGKGFYPPPPQHGRSFRAAVILGGTKVA